MKYEQIKSKASAAFIRMVDTELSNPGVGNYLGSGKPENLSFMALAAELGMTETVRRSTLSEVKAKGLGIISDWDVRNVRKLIELFPESVPAKYRGKQLTCYMADNEDCDWMVEIVQPEPSLERSRPAMRM